MICRKWPCVGNKPRPLLSTRTGCHLSNTYLYDIMISLGDMCNILDVYVLMICVQYCMFTTADRCSVLLCQQILSNVHDKFLLRETIKANLY